MKKYRMFIASFTYGITSESYSEFDYAVIAPETEADQVDNVAHNEFQRVAVRPTYEEALAFASEMVGKVSIVRQPRTLTSLHTYSVEFDTHLQAQKWLEHQRESRKCAFSNCHIETITFDENELDEYQHNPCYTVELEVTVTKRIEVEIDTSSGAFDHIEDEFDAEQAAVDMAENGDLQDEIDCAPEWDVEFNATGTVED